MKTNQPNWKLVANLGDVNPVEYGGYFVFEDTTGVYAPEAELLIAPDDDGGTWEVYRFALDRCTLTNGVLSANKYHPEHEEWFGKQAANIASFIGVEKSDLIEWFCSKNAIDRATAYRAAGDYLGFENFDSYPLRFHSSEAIERYADGRYTVAAEVAK